MVTHQKEAGVNILQNSPRIIGEKFPIFLRSGKSLMKFSFVRVFEISDWEVLTTWRKTFLNVKRNSTQLKGIVSYDKGESNANYPKMSRFTHKFGENIAINT